MASIILKWKTFGTTRTLPRAGHPAKLSYRGEKSLGERGKTQRSLWLSSRDAFGRWEKECCRKSNHHCSPPPVGALWQSGPTEASPQCKTHESPHGFAKKHLKDWLMRQDKLFGLNSKRMCGENQACSSPVQYSPNSEAWWWQHHAVGGVFQLQGQDDWLQLRERWMRPSTGYPGRKPSPECSGLRLGRRFTFQQDNDPKHTAKITKEWLHNNSVTVLEWPSQSPDLNPIEHLWRDPKNGCPPTLPSNLTELERICKEEWQEDPQIQVWKTCASFPKSHGCIKSKGLLLLNTEKRVEYLGPCDISVFLFNKSAKMSTILCFFCQYGVRVCVPLMRKKKWT